MLIYRSMWIKKCYITGQNKGVERALIAAMTDSMAICLTDSTDELLLPEDSPNAFVTIALWNSLVRAHDEKLRPFPRQKNRAASFVTGWIKV